jgi:hypothetical protein
MVGWTRSPDSEMNQICLGAVEMKRAYWGVVAAVGAMLSVTAASAADSAEWKTRCKRELGNRNDPETAKYFFRTPGMAEGALGQAEMEYSVTGSRTAAIYPTAEKDFMSPWNGATFYISYDASFDADPPHEATLRVGQVNALVSTKDGKTLRGPIKIKLVIDGKSFGPYKPKESGLSSGLYSIWFDTLETDGDNKPPVLDLVDFNKLAKATASMKTAEMVLLRGKTEIVRLPVAINKRDSWIRDFTGWASSARSFIKMNGGCPNALDTNW